MSKWDEQLSNHAINITLANLSERLKENVLISDDINIIELVDKIRQLITYTEICLENVIPQLINIATLNTANSHMTNVQNELNNYISTKNIGHLNNAVNHVDTVTVQLNTLPIPRPHLTGDSFGSSLVEFKKLMENSFHEVKDLKDRLETSISDISLKSETQSANLDELSKIIEQHKENISLNLSEFSQGFHDFENDFSNKLNLKISDNEEKLSEAIQSQKNEFEENLNLQKEKGEEIIDGLENNKKQASDLVQIIGNIGITGNYQKIANQEKESADKWRNIALFLMVGMVVVIATTIGISATNGFDWKLALFRIGAALVLAIPATYAARESAKHRLLENYNRKAELELASLDPFLEKLPEDTRNKVKEELTSKFFGMTGSEVKHEESVGYTALFELLKTAITKK